jgi:hypothetical protein
MTNSQGVLTETAIREKAFELWMARGCPAGSAERDWLDAEQLLIEANTPRPLSVVAPKVEKPRESAPEEAAPSSRSPRNGLLHVVPKAADAVPAPSVAAPRAATAPTPSFTPDASQPKKKAAGGRRGKR